MNTSLQHRPGALDVLQHDYILLDSSGSMTPKWMEVLDSIQSYIDGLNAGAVHSQIILHQFDSTDRDLIARDVPIDQWTDLRKEPVGLHGGRTPLYDAIMLMGKRLRELDPPRCSIVIVTDGQQNGSEFCDANQAKAILDWMRAKGWQVTFIGASFNNAEQARALGVDATGAIGVSQQRLSHAASELAKKRVKHFLYGTPITWSEADQENFGGYLGGPSA